MFYLSQRDPRWASEKLGSSPLTLGRFGCTTTGISMLSDYFTCYQSPIQIAHNVNNYTAQGLVIWKNLKFLKMKFDRREFGENKAEILGAMKDPNRGVLLEVNNGQHWVVGVKKALLSDDWVVIDPWDGKKKNAKAAYHNITGAAFFKGT